MDYDIEVHCEYFDCGVCCHPELSILLINEVSTEYCSVCLFKKLPVKLKAIKLLQDLKNTSNRMREIFDQLLIPDDIKETLQKYDEKIKEITCFLISVDVTTEELTTSDEIQKLMENEDGNN